MNTFEVFFVSDGQMSKIKKKIWRELKERIWLFNALVWREMGEGYECIGVDKKRSNRKKYRKD